MGFDLFMAVVAIVLAIFLTWLTLWLFFGQNRGDAVNGTVSDATAAHNATDATENGGNQHSGMSEAGLEHTGHIRNLMLLSAVLTLAIIATTLLDTTNTHVVPSWVTSVWLRAIFATPILFYCGRPIHRVGWAALSHRVANTDSLVMLGSALSYAYSLVLCIAPNLLPAALYEWGFALMGVAITLVLLCHQFNAETMSPAKERALASRVRISRIVVPAVLLVATWAFAIEIVFGPQPRLALAVMFASIVLILAGLIMSAAWLALERFAAPAKG
ncbi:MAG: hypothetical protein LKF49_08475 [Bifidobacterium tibiigranuli]|uniref:hypothetical protein n=1 Tax=Bifidobacterium tibiigranuli TaxID=2172043 RepID=UPI002356F085|nr:hypothetical protein [Bifidobacterium tibiigranuli]MCH3975416.1 hypothetical protein [Bifidobacterium tibiigranuli]MCH4189686.1 hypothetical protein [Bifidobacterium tibiigranuli]MCH4204225.1 hypothetical protein [Bifidobacterium tibiigranuli]MCH4274578.1 hypothetical protein [Bifidobacterium tibiigranuli]MCI1255058.1 hypothetical protein [Bifidobacterium tibiigranuli]